MSYLSMMEATMPPGFRFHPRDEELVCDYLAKKINGDNTDRSLYDGCPTLMSVDLNKCEPWDLPEIACVGGKEYYFYSLRDRKYATGQRTNRATISGYWKATGKDRPVFRKGGLVGMRKTLVFYQGRAPKGKKTDWVMHEFRMESPGHTLKLPVTKEDWVLCRVFYKSRGLTSKPITMMNTTNYEDTIASPSLPQLTETYITFNAYDQVPCFSNNQFQNNPMAMIGRSMAIKNDAAAQMDGLDQLSLNQVGCDRNGIVDVLNQLTKMEEKTKREAHTDSYGEGNIDSYFSENGGSNMW